MTKVVALLFFACCGVADASLGSFLKTLTGKTARSIQWRNVCVSMGKNYQGYGWSMGGGSTTIDVTCSGQKISLVCKGYPKFTKCTSSSADGDSSGGCTCSKDYPKCEKNAWCYNNGGKWSNTVCPGSCTEPAASGCECPSAYPFCHAQNKWCYKSAGSNRYTAKCARECTAHAPKAPSPPPPPPASGCTCPSSFPFCYGKNQWCYKSSTSSKYTGTCARKCTASAAGAGAKIQAKISGGSGSQVAKIGSCGTKDSFTTGEAQEMLDLHNKFRCAVGTPPLQWNAALQCQAQKTQDQIGAFSHSSSYGKPISAGENLATGSSPSMAAWMWFTEYTQSKNTGHFTAMVWKAGTEVGCGIQRNSGGVIRCQYAAAPPNFGGASDFAANVPKFIGEKSKFEKCGLTIAEVKQHVKQYSGWGILKPESSLSASLGLFELDGEYVAWVSTPGMMTIGVAFAFAAFAMVGVVFVVRRTSWQTRDHASLLPCDEEEASMMEDREARSLQRAEE